MPLVLKCDSATEELTATNLVCPLITIFKGPALLEKSTTRRYRLTQRQSRLKADIYVTPYSMVVAGPQVSSWCRVQNARSKPLLCMSLYFSTFSTLVSSF